MFSIISYEIFGSSTCIWDVIHQSRFPNSFCLHNDPRMHLLDKTSGNGCIIYLNIFTQKSIVLTIFQQILFSNVLKKNEKNMFFFHVNTLPCRKKVDYIPTPTNNIQLTKQIHLSLPKIPHQGFYRISRSKPKTWIT